MSLEILSRDVMSLADKEIEIIKKDFDSKLDSIKLELGGDLDSHKSKIQGLYDREYSLSKSSILGNANKMAKASILGVKSQIVLNVFNEALEKLNNLDSKKKTSFYKALGKKVKKELDFKKVFTSKEDLKLAKEIFKDSEVLEAEIIGLRFESGDSKLIVDMSFESLLIDFFSEREGEIQRRLFN